MRLTWARDNNWMRLRPSFSESVAVLIVSFLLSEVASAEVVYSQGKTISVSPTTNEIIIELDGTRLSKDVLFDLANAGIPTATHVEGLASKFQFRRLSVNPNDQVAVAKVRAIAGISGIRKSYQFPGYIVPLVHSGQVVAKFQPGTPMVQVNAIAQYYGATVERRINGLPNTYVLRAPEDGGASDAVSVAAALHNDSNIVYSHPSFFVPIQKQQLAPIEDPLYAFQWHLNNTAQLPSGRIDADIDAPEAWGFTQGSGAVVGVIDDAVNWEHEDLIDNFLLGFDFTDGDTDPSPEFGIFGSDEAHGTAVSGLICAAANQIGVRGVAPEAKFIGCRALSSFTQDISLADALLFCELNGAMAINNSWGGPGFAILPTIPNTTLLLPDVITDAIDEITTTGRQGKGVLVMFSAGNDDMLLDFGNAYAGYKNTMSVGATLRDDTLACYSNFGTQQSVVAPGGGVSIPRGVFFGGIGFFFFFNVCSDSDIATTDVMDSLLLPTKGYNPPTRFIGNIEVIDNEISDFPDVNYTHHFNGTSAACPIATGVAALVFSVNPDLTAEQARNLIEHTADKPTAAVKDSFDAVSGQNDRYGHGRVNALRAVQAATAGNNWPTPVKDIQTVSSQASARIIWTNPVNDASGVLIARSNSTLDWAPTDGIAYSVGQPVAPGVDIVANDLIELLDQTGLLTGTFQYALFVRNDSNFYSWGRRTSFAAQSPTNIPLASISSSVTAGVAPLKVHFAGGGVDKNGIVSFNWNFGDGTTGTGPAVDHIFTSGGDYLVTLTVANAGAQTAQATTLISVSGSANQLPTASFTSIPQSGDAPLVVLFQGVASDTDGAIASVQWDFGDGTQGSGMTVEHIYIVPGTYAVIFTATDSVGAKATATEVINVTGSGVTAGNTDPPGILTPTPTCGTGVAGASISSLAIFLAFMGVRRRY